ncbi:MAG TPA: hypothetical protein VLQ45_34000 [Thermoanaerobaculia bacterium]|nr:hypothetical protein [Thermoanaerobaculia bacterium]
MARIGVMRSSTGGDVPPWVDGEALVMIDWNVSTDRDCRSGTGNPAVGDRRPAVPGRGTLP